MEDLLNDLESGNEVMAIFNKKAQKSIVSLESNLLEIIQKVEVKFKVSILNEALKYFEPFVNQDDPEDVCDNE